MERCYIPAIILFILNILLVIQVYDPVFYGSALVLGSIPLFFVIISWLLCKKGYKKLAWIAPLGSLIVLASVVALM